MNENMRIEVKSKKYKSSILYKESMTRACNSNSLHLYDEAIKSQKK